LKVDRLTTESTRDAGAASQQEQAQMIQAAPGHPPPTLQVCIDANDKRKFLDIVLKGRGRPWNNEDQDQPSEVVKSDLLNILAGCFPDITSSQMAITHLHPYLWERGEGGIEAATYTYRAKDIVTGASPDKKAGKQVQLLTCFVWRNLDVATSLIENRREQTGVHRTDTSPCPKFHGWKRTVPLSHLPLEMAAYTGEEVIPETEAASTGAAESTLDADVGRVLTEFEARVKLEQPQPEIKPDPQGVATRSPKRNRASMGLALALSRENSIEK